MPHYIVVGDFSANITEYGIALFEGETELQTIPKLSPCKEDVESLTAMLNELSIEPCHFEDIVEDYLTDFTI